MSDHLQFATRAEFRAWLSDHYTGEGVWLLFGKAGGPKTLKAAEALEEALCYGWIDGQIVRLDDTRYRKYFSPRRPGSNWSDKNKGLVKKLEESGRIEPPGRQKIQQAKQDGSWDSSGRLIVTDEMISELQILLDGCEPALTNFLGMPPSVRKSYAGLYFDAKTEAGRARRLEKIIGRLNQNLKPM